MIIVLFCNLQGSRIHASRMAKEWNEWYEKLKRCGRCFVCNEIFFFHSPHNESFSLHISSDTQEAWGDFISNVKFITLIIFLMKLNVSHHFPASFFEATFLLKHFKHLRPSSNQEQEKEIRSGRLSFQINGLSASWKVLRFNENLKKKMKLTQRWFKSGENGFDCVIKLPSEDSTKEKKTERMFCLQEVSCFHLLPPQHKKLMKYAFFLRRQKFLSAETQ